jgi:multiple sugar transport system ATP-binding protein
MNLLPCRPEGAALVGEHGWTLPRPAWAVGESGRPLLLGLRAEDLSLDRRDGGAAIGGSLYALEPLGDRTLVDVDVGGALVKVKARPSVTGSPGEPLQLAVDLDRAHLFDAETGDAVAR